MKNVEQNNHFSVSGFNLIEVGNEVWVFQVVGVESFLGTFKEALLIANLKCGISLKELDLAIQSMTQLGHNAAHFGRWGTFIFTFNKEFEKERMVS